nr:hypothetical protein Iba_chr02bCG24400 [Ipomoea batatas]
MTAGHLNHELKYEKNQRSRKRRMKKNGNECGSKYKKRYFPREKGSGEQGSDKIIVDRTRSAESPKNKRIDTNKNKKTKSQRMTSTYLERDMEKGRERLRYVCAD